MTPPRPTVTLGALFTGFLRIGLFGFGGVAPWARHVIVEERLWLDDQEYAAVIAVGQALPGANTVNAAVMIGDRFAGPAGSVAGVLGLLIMPLFVLVGFAALYARYAAVPDFAAALAGAGSAAAGLVIGTALRMARGLRPTRGALLFGSAAFVGVGLFGWPLGSAVVVLAPLAAAAAALERRT